MYFIEFLKKSQSPIIIFLRIWQVLKDNFFSYKNQQIFKKITFGTVLKIEPLK